MSTSPELPQSAGTAREAAGLDGLVLVVDDQPESLAATLRILRRAGIGTESATCGREALDRIRERSPALVLLDVVLPDLDGREVLRQVRADPSNHETLIVLFSAIRVDAQHQAEGLEAGADGYIARPVTANELLARVRLHLRQWALTQQVRASQERFELAQTAAQMGTWELDPSSMNIVLSAGTYRILGLCPEAFRPTRETLRRLIHPEDLPGLGEAIRRSRQTQTSATSRIRIGPAGPRWKILEICWQAFPGRGVRRDRIVGTCRDITDSARLEETARQAQFMANVAERLGQIGGWSLELPEYRLRWSDQVCLLHDLPPGHQPTLGEALGYYLAEDRAAAMERIRTCAESGTGYTVELVRTTATGRRRWALSTAEAVRDSDGRIIRVQGAFQDITLRREAELELRQKDALMRIAGRVTRTGGWSISLPQKALFMSDETYELLHYPRDRKPDLTEALGYYPEPGRDAVIHALAACAENGTSFSLETEATTAVGGRLWVRVCGEPDLNPDGTIKGIHGAFQDITAQKQGEAALRESEAELRALADSMPQMVWVASPDVSELYMNTRWIEYTGLTLEECRGWGWLQAFHPEDRPRARAAWEAAQNGADYSLECRVRRVDGHHRWMLARGLPYKDLSGRVTKFMGTCTDIDDLKSTQRVLQLLSQSNALAARAETEDELLKEVCRLAVELGGFRMAWVGYAKDDPAGRIVPQASAGFHDVYLTQSQFSWREDSTFGNGPAGRAIRLQTPVAVTDVSSDPSIAPWRDLAADCGFRGIVALPLKEEHRAFGVLLVYLDEEREITGEELQLLQEVGDNFAFSITHIQARNAARVAQERVAQQAALLDHATDAILVGEAAGQITYWNQSAQRLYGWSAEEVLGRQMSDVFGVGDSAEFQEATSRLITERRWSGDLRQTTKSGREIVVEARWTLMSSDEGRPHAILLIHTDQTERRQLEAQMLRAQRMESIGTLAGGIAHDLNNLLAPIVMGVGLLEQCQIDEDARRIVRRIQQSADRGTNLVKQVLSFARGLDGTRVTLNLAHVVREVEAMIATTFPKNIRVEHHLDRTTWAVEADPTQLSQVMLNLSVNARDAMAAGGCLNIATYNTVVDAQYAGLCAGAAPGNYAVIRVQDSGCGMSRQIKDRIFEPFFTTKELGKGTGLGLSTALGIVRSHGGFIEVDSEPGEGTTFRVYLPAVGSATEPPDDASAADPAPRGNGQCILVVDDESAIADIMRQTLETFGYKVLTAEDGASAVAIFVLHREEIALVLTDMMMPIMDGPALITALRQIDRNVKVLAASGRASEEGLHSAGKISDVRILKKPHSASLLLRTIAEVLLE